MRLQSKLTAALLIALTPLATAIAQDDLFSGVAIESVFNASASSDATDAKASLTSSTRLTDADAVVALLTTAGLEAKRAGSKTASTKLNHAGWSLPVSVEVDVDQDLVLASMTLVVAKENQDWDASRLLKLLTVNYGKTTSYFAYNADERKLQVRRQLTNRGLTAKQLEQTLRQMANFAIARQSLWSLEKPTSTPQPAAQSTSQIATGVWVASINDNEAFAIRFDADGRFKLVHVKGKQELTSTGKTSRQGDRLTLAADDGKSISGTVYGVTTNQFNLQLGGRSLVFKKS